MKNKYSKEYDVTIIGGGIGGLVCGCYLAKEGLRVLIVEQHFIVGGYCSSFLRQGYRFDTGVHYIGGIKKGILSGIFTDLGISKYVNFSQRDPTDKIILPDTTTYIRANYHDTISEFRKTFPKEFNNIDRFFNFVAETSVPELYRKLIKVTLRHILDSFFKDDNLKSTIGLLLLGNIGLPPNQISAFAAVIFFREFLLDPGYYPSGGMQRLPDTLAKIFKNYGGELILAKKVTKIIIERNVVEGITLESKENIRSQFIVSDIDATQLFKYLIDKKTKELEAVDKMVTTNSVFAVCLGISPDLRNSIKESCNIWFFTTNKIDKCFKLLKTNIRNNTTQMIMLSFPSRKDFSLVDMDKEVIQLFTLATFEDREFWSSTRKTFANNIISLAEKVIPNLQKNIDIIVTATPYTFYEYTLNRNGAAFGWASSLSQMDTSLLPQITSIKNLFLVGHWCTMGAGQGGISTVSLSGKKVAEIIINFIK